MKIYTWQVLGLCEVRFWKGSGIVETDNGNYLYYSGEEKYHINGVEFLFHKDIKYFITEFKPISSRICTSRLRAKSLIISIIQIHAPTSDYTDKQLEIFYSSLQERLVCQYWKWLTDQIINIMDLHVITQQMIGVPDYWNLYVIMTWFWQIHYEYTYPQE